MIERTFSFAPTGSRAPAAPSVWYPLHEAAGSTFAERLQGAAPLRVQGAALVASGRYGSVRPNPPAGPKPQYLSTDAAGVSLQSIFGLGNLAGQHLLIGLEMEAETAVTAGGLLWWGQTGGAAGSSGANGWGLRLGTDAGRPLELVVRGQGAASARASTVIAQMPRGPSSRQAVVVELIGLSATQASARVYLRPFAPANADADRDMTEPVDLLTGGSAAPAGDGPCGLTLFAERLQATEVGGVVSGAWFTNVWAQRRTAIDESLGQRCCADMVDAPREFPACLRG